jgi:hypothetical protein
MSVSPAIRRYSAIDTALLLLEQSDLPAHRSRVDATPFRQIAEAVGAGAVMKASPVTVTVSRGPKGAGDRRASEQAVTAGAHF